jgi:uncharacterized protein (DUF362 family)
MHSAYIDSSKDIMDNLRKALKFIEYKKLIKSDMRVFVKPNFTFPTYREGVTTNPKVLDLLLGMLKDAASDVTVVESDGGNNSFSADAAFAGHGMDKICRKNGVSMLNLSRTPWKQVSGTVNSKKVSVTLPSILIDRSDILVAVPVVKVHAMTRITLSLKNLWGCNPDTMRCLSHQNLDRKLALMASVLRLGLVVIDGSYALDNHGPMFGTPLRKDLLIASDNAVVADSLGAHILGVNPRSIGHIKQAEDYGLGTTDLSRVRLNMDWRSLRFGSTLGLTLVDRLSWIPFKNDQLARLIFQSPFTGIIRSVANKLKIPEERIDFNSYDQRGDECDSGDVRTSGTPLV